MPDCSVIIPVHNRAALTQHCLTNVLAHSADGIETEIVVVDDASDDATPRILDAYGDRIRVVKQSMNSGFATACNDGAMAARGDYLVFLHNDALPQPGWLDNLVVFAEAHPAAAIVGSKILTSDGAIQHAGIVIGQDGQPHYLYSGFSTDHPATKKSRQFQAVTMACALVRRAAFEQVGGFDTAFRSSAADLDFCLRISESNHEIHFCHTSVVHHLSRLDAALKDAARGSHDAQDAQLFASRWGHRLQPDDVRYYLEDNLLTINYEDNPLLEIGASPLLAVFKNDDHRWMGDQLLHARSRQVTELLQKNIELILRIDEQERDLQALARQLSEATMVTQSPQ